MSVRRSTRAAVAEALAAVAKDLGIPRIQVRWFKGANGYWDESDAALYALSSRIRYGLHGAAVSALEPPVIWLRATLRPAVAALLAAHEARHVWQERMLDERDHRRWHEPTSERDAETLRRSLELETRESTLKARATFEDETRKREREIQSI